MIAQLEQLLQRTIGLDPAAIGAAALERAVQRRIEQTGAASAADYLERVRVSPLELQALIETVVVPETWFFRDRAAFTALGRYARDEWRRAHPEGTLRLLSAACASGEEPCSMAAALLDAGVPPRQFTIDAVDISGQSLAAARLGVYGRNSFRGDDHHDFRDRFCEPTESGQRVKAAVRARIHYLGGNLLDPDLLADHAPYHVVFCRNVLIYFDAATQTRVLQNLTRLLADDGLLFVGPSETGRLLKERLTYSRWPRSFAFRKGPPAPITPRPRRRDARESERSRP